ncbi:RNA polymerase [Ascodesmis nigricans]|uniref:DNA-directed RNA polymerases I, II, and III subunit RPABC3 n=1 Tax=Ascodesmis nigricans TaxID=341454 RepID=A0A4S2N5Q6_9PEZI|nr:RNA polymerase [Ascodesmis nigricans]
MSADALLLDATFTITATEQKKYDRVARITGEREDLKFLLDINCEIYQVHPGDNVQLCIASTLSLDGTIESQEEFKKRGGWRDTRAGEATLADSFDYVCHGKVYRFEESASGEQIKVYASFGGLLLFIEGPHKRLSPLKHDYIYLLMKK